MSRRGVAVAATVLVLCAAAQDARAQRDRIGGTIDRSRTVALSDHVHRLATAANDRGRVDAAMPMTGMTLMFSPSPGQQADLDALLARQQDPSSPDYHQWLTPEQFGARFGLSANDLASTRAWLESEGLTVTSVARGGNSISFKGRAGQVEKAFHTQIHSYSADGAMHYANATEPSIPAALSGILTAIRGLHNFRLKPYAAHYTAPATAGTNGCSPATGGHQLVPDDIAAIYDIKALYNQGITGAGQTIAVAGQTQITLSDIESFRSCFGLAANDPKLMLVPNLPDPGISQADLGEAELDVETAGAVARGATVIFVYSANVDDAASYIINNDVAPVMSVSYGLCEPQTGSAFSQSQRTLAQQGNAQGITWVNATGDNGAADCFSSTSRNAAILAVDEPADIPEVTGVGGTELNEGAGTYWSATNTPNQASALGWIPETTWNDSVLDGSPSASGGGASAFFSKPSWQTGTGVPNDSARDVPDVAMAASADHDGYLIYTSGSMQVYGGTSIATPLFAGIVTLLNQYEVANGLQKAPGMGNINPRLYAMASSVPGAFHDITTGSNAVDPCSAKARSCNPAPIGYNAGPGYDEATGLGSVDVFNLLTGWSQAGSGTKATPLMTLSSSAASIPLTGSATLTASLKASSGTTSPTGHVTWYLNGASVGLATLSGSGGTATASLTVTGPQLAVGALTLTATYGGDASFNPATSTQTLTVTSSSSATAPSIGAVTNGASFQQTFAPGMILSVFGTQMAGSTITTQVDSTTGALPTQAGGVTVNIDGIPAPLYYVSPTQINLQIPYTVPAGARATLVVTYNGQSGSITFPVIAAAPGIFFNPSTGVPVGLSSVSLGQEIAIYVTGAGNVNPQPAAGATPAAGTTPAPSQTVTVTVGGATVPSLIYEGVPSWGIGVVQLNFTIPANALPGTQSLVVTVGSVSSPPATLNITN